MIARKSNNQISTPLTSKNKLIILWGGHFCKFMYLIAIFLRLENFILNLKRGN